MESKAHLIYFSPTRSTKGIVEQIAIGLGPCAIEHHDLTRVERGLDLQLSDGIAVIGIPVYAGRVPELFLQRINGLSATGIPTVLVAVYGNREFEDALVELREVASRKGFSVITAGAFIAEHSYSTKEQPIAAHRPDSADLEKAKEFGATIAKRLADNRVGMPNIPGNVPYKERVPLGGIAPETNHTLCTLCGTCADVCPAYVISVGNQVITEAGGCLLCCACVKSCPEKVRELKHPMVEARRQMLTKDFGRRKEPDLFV